VATGSLICACVLLVVHKLLNSVNQAPDKNAQQFAAELKGSVTKYIPRLQNMSQGKSRKLMTAVKIY
jgi:hypothetical protein